MTDLLDEFANLSDELFSLNVIRTDSFTGEIGEYIFSQAFDLQRTDRSSEAVDCIDKQGIKYQIKSKVVSNEKFNYSLSKLSPNLFDYLVVIFFDELYNPIKAYKINSKFISTKVSINNKFLNTIDYDIIDPNRLIVKKEIREKLNNFGFYFIKLKEHGKTNSRHLVGDIGEHYAAEQLNLTLCKKNQKGIDAVDKQNNTYEIKTRRVYESGRREGNARRLNGLCDKCADFLVVVTLDRTFKCNGMWKMPLKNVKNPKSAHLGIVKSTSDVEIIIPTNIDWLK